ncbi:hypothetical protein FGIG_08916 [Fasciola gigantica]|uniref:PWI domain-containing protein n=1 Tax=Fasciola gigantica TaxID=46835 RepID=A0A504YI64_FASGI|nr:hypothetical protein FGIG_08916 [Fasciola gigantica]
MTDAGFFKGTSTEQDARFSDKKKKLMKTMKFGENLSQKVDMTRVNLDCIKPWIVKRVTELLNFEDEVVWDYVLNQLDERYPDPKEIQINITGFLNSKNARIFLTELWDLLLSAMQDPEGVPAMLIEAKKAEIANRQLDERQVQMEVRRKQEELKMKAAIAQTTSVASTGHQQSGLPSRPVPNGSNNEVAGNQPRTMQSNDVKAAQPVSLAPGKEMNNRNTVEAAPEKDNEQKKRHKEKRRHRSRSSSSDSSDDSRDHHRSRHRHRSKSVEAVVKKPPVPDSDWRKDLMAGRRRSPPPMPENSYYGYEKRRKDRKHSRHRHRSSDWESEHHRSHHSHSRGSRRRGDSPSRRPREDEPRDYWQYERRSGKHRDHVESSDDPNRRYRDRQPKHESRSPSPGSPKIDPTHANPADRANRFHDRRAQWAQEEDDLRVHSAPDSSNKRTKYRVSADLGRRQPLEDTTKSRTPEGPCLPQPPKEASRSQQAQQRQPQKSQSTSSSSDSESGSSSSSSEDSSSSCDSSSDSENDTAQVPEGPSLPPSSKRQSPEPEGPALPPIAVAAPSRSTTSKPTSDLVSSDTSGSDSDSDDGSSSSSSDSEDSSDSSSESDEENKNAEGPSLPPKRKRSDEDSKPSKLEPKRREIPPEGPKLPSEHTSESNPQRNYSERGNGKSPERQHRKSKREDSAEALRRRALASLIQASGRRHRRDSHSP